MEEKKQSVGRWLLSAVLWIIIAGGGLTLIQPILVIFFAIGLAIRSGEVTGVIMDKYRIISARQFGVLAYGGIWLAGIIALGTYFGQAKTTAALLKRFGLLASIEVSIWLIGWILQERFML